MEENLQEAKSKKKFFQDKKNIAIIILSVLLFFALGSPSKTSVETSTNLTSALTEKEQTIQANQKQIEDLQKENNILIQEKMQENKSAKILGNLTVGDYPLKLKCKF